MSGIANMMFANRTPPAVGGGSGDTYWTNTQILMHFEGSDGGTTFTDSSQNAYSFSRGSANTQTTSSTQKKWGSTSFYDNGTSGSNRGLYLAGTKPSVLQLQGNFTVEWWGYHKSNTGAQGYFGTGQSLFHITLIWNGGTPFFEVEKSTGAWYSGYKATDWKIATSNFDSWHHYAFVRNGNAMTFYLDGSSVTQSGQVYGNTSDLANFFTDGSPYSGKPSFNNDGVAVMDTWCYADYGGRQSYVDDFRFTNIARYTSNFTAPSAAFPDSA